MKVFFKSDAGQDGFSSINGNAFWNQTGKFRIVNMPHLEPVDYNMLIELADTEGLDMLSINDTVEPKIVKLLDMQKHVYEIKKAKKMAEKKQKANAMKNKEIRISLGISPHDLDMKVNHTKEFADQGSKVKFILRLRGREGVGEDAKNYVKNFFKDVLTKFEGYTVDGPKYLGNSYWADITKNN